MVPRAEVLPERSSLYVVDKKGKVVQRQVAPLDVKMDWCRISHSLREVKRQYEIVIGEHLGRGGFSDVAALREIKIIKNEEKEEESSHNDDEEKEENSSHHFFFWGNFSDDVRYAIKQLRKDVKNDEKLAERGVLDLALEVRFLSSIQHAHIINLHAAGGREKESFLVLDRLVMTLEKRIVAWKKEENSVNVFEQLQFWRGRNNTLRERLSAALDLADAVDYLHERNIIHRDIKPTNIGFDMGDAIKLFDFGLAKQLPPGCDETHKLTIMAGTLRYMAPEVALGLPYNTKCDVYSFSILLWEMIALEQPFSNYNIPSAFIHTICRGGKRPCLGCCPRVIKRQLQNCWIRDIDRRYDMKQAKRMLHEELSKLE